MITIGSVDSIRNLPSTALFGSSLFFFFLLGAICFLIPSALVAAELSSSWAEQGGVYVWVREAFGKRFGFLAIWFQWAENLFWYPTILSFIAGTIAYIFLPSLATNKLFLVAVILSIFWAVTIINILGMRSSAWVSNFCGVAGLIIPMALIIGLGAVWLFGNHPLQIHFTEHSMLPHFGHSTMWVALTGIMLSFCGMEIATVHAADVKNPQKAFPRALFYSVTIILATLIMGSLAIAIVIPEKDISLVAGIMQAFSTFFHAYHLGWILPIVGILLVVGGIGAVNNWTIAPLKGLIVAAEDGNLPKSWAKENKHHAPITLLIGQGVVVTILAFCFLYLPSINESYWLLNALASQLYMLMYILMFAAGIWLRFKFPERHRPYKIPGGKIGMILVGGIGIIACTVTVAVGFFPPSVLHVKSVFEYESLIVGAIAIAVLLPVIISLFYSKKSS
jgi:amino acid transporter